MVVQFPSDCKLRHGTRYFHLESILVPTSSRDLTRTWTRIHGRDADRTKQGHAASVLHLACDDDNFQIISVSSDNVFKVWDIRNHRCLQTFTDRFK